MIYYSVTLGRKLYHVMIFGVCQKGGRDMVTKIATALKYLETAADIVKIVADAGTKVLSLLG